MNELHSVFKTVEEQKKILEERGMIVDDISILKEFNYSHIIYKYGDFYNENKKGEVPKYKENTKLSYLKELYNLNAKISMYFYRGIGKIESMLKVIIAKYLSKIDTVFWLNKDNFHFHYEPKSKEEEEEKLKNELDNFLKNLKKLNNLKKNKYEPKYLINGDLPMWLLVDEMAFGQLRMIIKFSGKQKEILKELKLHGRNDLKLLIDINKIRNRTHHYNPILNTRNSQGQKSLINNALRLIKLCSKENYNKIIETFNNFNFEDIKINKEEFNNNYLKVKLITKIT